MVKTLQILFFPSTPKFKNTVLCWCTAKCPRLFITLGESRKTPCLSNHMWHFATGDSQFEVGFLPFLWPNAATKMQKIASWEQAFVRVASGVYFECAKPCNHNQVPISNTDGWIPLLFSPQPGVQPMYSVHVWRNSNDVSKCGRYWLLASLFQLQSPLQAGGSGKKKQWSKALAPSSTTFPLFLTLMRRRCDAIIFTLVSCRDISGFLLILLQQTNILADKEQNNGRINVTE